MKLNVPFKDQALHFQFEENELIGKTRDGIKTIQLKVKFKSSKNPLLKSFNDEMGVLKMEKINASDDSYLLFFPITRKADLSTLLSKYDATGLVEFIEPNIILKVNNSLDLIENVEEEQLKEELLDTNDIYDDKYYNLQWHFKNTGQFNGIAGEDVKLEKAWKYIKTKNVSLTKGVKVAILDDGVDPNHKDLDINNYVKSFDLVDNDDKPIPTGLLSHGTNISGVVAAIKNNQFGIAGINPFSKLIVGRIYGRLSSSNNPVRTAKGIKEAVNRGAKVINLSWGFKNPSSEIINAINNAVHSNVLVVASSGNYFNSNDTGVLFPGNLNNVLTVGACDNKGRWINLRNCEAKKKFGSRYGKEVDIVAPGVNIITTQYDHKNFPNRKSFNYFHGTSVATAIVSSIASMLYMIKPDIKMDEIRSLLLNTADDISGQQGMIVGFDHVGHGRINAYKAVKKLVESMKP